MQLYLIAATRWRDGGTQRTNREPGSEDMCRNDQLSNMSAMSAADEPVPTMLVVRSFVRCLIRVWVGFRVQVLHVPTFSNLEPFLSPTWVVAATR